MPGTSGRGRLARRSAVVLTLFVALAAGPRELRAAQKDVRHPFQRDVSVLVPAGSLSASSGFQVPAGQRLVIELVTGFTRVHVAELVRLTVATQAGSGVVVHHVAPSVYRRELPPGVAPDFMVTFSQPVRIYADPGTQVTVTAARSENAEITPTFFALSLSGYLVDCGPAPGCPIP